MSSLETSSLTSSPALLGTISIITYTVLEETYRQVPDDAKETVTTLSKTHDVSSLLFMNVISVRSAFSFLECKGYLALDHWNVPGTLTFEQFSQLLSVPQTISNPEWHSRCNEILEKTH